MSGREIDLIEERRGDGWVLAPTIQYHLSAEEVAAQWTAWQKQNHPTNPKEFRAVRYIPADCAERERRMLDLYPEMVDMLRNVYPIIPFIHIPIRQDVISMIEAAEEAAK